MSESDVIAAMKAKPREPVDLTEIRNVAAELRDSYLRKADLEQQMKTLDSQIKKVEREQLPEMFQQAGVSSVTVEADGNHPAFIAERNTVYTASIPEDKRLDALQWFESQGHGDLVKSVINIYFGMQEHARKLKIMKLLDTAGVQYYTNESVHHMTLKSFVKRELQEGRVLPNDLLGVYVFDEVKIK